MCDLSAQAVRLKSTRLLSQFAACHWYSVVHSMLRPIGCTSNMPKAPFWWLA